MKKSLRTAVLLLLALFPIATAISAQTITVTPVRSTYRRPKPITPYKKTFSVIRPKVKGVAAALAKKIETTIGYEKNFDFSVQEEIKEIQWLEEASFDVDYNKRGILGVSLTIDGSGAYPDGSTKPVVVNIKTGNRVLPQDVFTSLNGLAAKAKVKQQAEIKQGLTDIKKEEPDAESPENLFESADFTAEGLKEFSVSDKGVTFWYDYGFPHVIQAMEPEGRYFFTWAELKPYIKQGSLFAQFVR
ncbi:MAG TPA: hypothetical protein VGO50_17505 [Pyrinomonadaceae bacterium]|jgi:hypothetical protein|nr:hypothetical protein [Pyrinomonadaceae bacterium]